MAKQKHVFQIIVEQDEAAYFVAECPALRACYTQGKTYAEVVGEYSGRDRTLSGRPEGKEERDPETERDHRHQASGGLDVSSADLPILKPRQADSRPKRIGFQLLCKSKGSHPQFAQPGRSQDNRSGPQRARHRPWIAAEDSAATSRLNPKTYRSGCEHARLRRCFAIRWSGIIGFEPDQFGRVVLYYLLHRSALQ